MGAHRLFFQARLLTAYQGRANGQAQAADASSTLMDLAPLLELWERSGREAVRRAVQEQTATAGGGQADCIDGGQCPATVAEAHRSFRRLVRRKAAELG